MKGFTYSCRIPALGHSRAAKWQFLSRSRLQILFALILSWLQIHGEDISTGDPVSLISFPAIWVQLPRATTVLVMMTNSARLVKNQIRNSLLLLSKGCQSNITSEEAWNMAYTCIYVPRLSSRNHKQNWQKKGEDYFCFEEEKYAELQPLSLCWLTARGIVCCFSGLILHVRTSTWEQTLNCNRIGGCDVQLFPATRQLCDNTYAQQMLYKPQGKADTGRMTSSPICSPDMGRVAYELKW